MELLRGKVGETKSTVSVERDWKGMTFPLVLQEELQCGGSPLPFPH